MKYLKNPSFNLFLNIHIDHISVVDRITNFHMWRDFLWMAQHLIYFENINWLNATTVINSVYLVFTHFSTSNAIKLYFPCKQLIKSSTLPSVWMCSFHNDHNQVSMLYSTLQICVQSDQEMTKTLFSINWQKRLTGYCFPNYLNKLFPDLHDSSFVIQINFKLNGISNCH
jgi:hypothetical protein